MLVNLDVENQPHRYNHWTFKPEKEIKLNGKNVDVKSKKWTNIFGYVSQNINLFNDTIYSNISLNLRSRMLI